MSPGVWNRGGEGEEPRFLRFLLNLILLFVLYPVMVELGQVKFFRLLVVVVLLVAAYTVGGERKHLVKALILGIPAMVAQIVVYSAPSRWTFLASAVFTIPFLIYVIVVIFAAVLRPGKVTFDKVAGAISVYLLLGLLWTTFYGTAVVFQPEAFEGVADVTLSSYLAAGAEYHFIYFSFVTLTTLGFGDLSPALPFTQTLAWMEAVTGQLFLALTIARLVGLLGREGGSRGD